MPNPLEKYHDLKTLFPERAGNIFRLLTSQKRIIEKLGHQKGETQALMIACAENYDATLELLAWMKDCINSIGEDWKHFQEGAKYRQIIADQTEFIGDLINARDGELSEVVKKVKERHAKV